jgi:hypothetical protein
MNNTNNITSNNTYYSYLDFIRNRKDFKVVNSEDIFDNPSALFYKIIFYFNKENGLLGTDKILESEISEFDKDYKLSNSNNYRNTAYNYLLLNNEVERAFLLKKFIYLLSNINSNTPWYFQEVSGIDNAIERKIFSEGEIKLDEKPRQLSIKCLNDSMDNRIGTLLDLYRSICYSYDKRKEIVPANLRKFNMGILIFSAPLRGYSGKSAGQKVYPRIPDKNTQDVISSAKFFEFRNCEFDYNSSKSAFSTLNTSESAFSPEYTITINYDDCYESRFNDVMQAVITDFINVEEGWDNSVNGSIVKNRNQVLNNRTEATLKGETWEKDLKTLEYYNDKLSFNDANKQYWINTDINSISEKTLTDYPRTINNNAVNVLENLGNGSYPTLFATQTSVPSEEFIQKQQLKPNIPKGNMFKTAMNNAVNTVKSAIQLPTIKIFNENIHDTGTVTRYGRYEYLNRIAEGGILGQAVNSFVGEGISELEQLGKIYLGNIRTMSIEDIEKQPPKGRLFDELEQRELSNGSTITEPTVRNLSNGSTITEPTVRNLSNGSTITEPTVRNLSNGSSGDIFEDQEPRSLDNYPIGTIPGYSLQKTQYLNKLNVSKSIRNNL